MLFLLALVLAVLLAYTGRSILKKHANLFYILAAVLSIAVTVFDFRGAPSFLQNYVIGLFSRGALATALWCVIMWIGALPNGSALMKAFMPIRGELSIFAAILTLGHNLGYGKTYFVSLFTDPGSMKPTQLTAGILSLLMLAIMIPLTILSFPKIRKKLSAKKWKHIQRTAYLFYAILYAHIMVLFVPMARAGRLSYQISVCVYSLVFIAYAVFRIRKAICKKHTVDAKLSSRISGAIVVAGMLVILLLIQSPKSAEPTTPVDTQQETIETTTISPETDADAETDTPAAETTVETAAQSLYKDGTYTASAYGYDGDITVTITIVNDTITAIDAQSAEEDLWYFQQAEVPVIDAILTTQSTTVDAVSGATYSSKGIMQAVEKALQDAKNVG